MLTTNDSRDNTVCFIEDLPNGSCLVACSCGHEFASSGENKQEFCKECKKEVFYPGWASW